MCICYKKSYQYSGNFQISVKTLLYLAYDLHQLSHTSHGEIWRLYRDD